MADGPAVEENEVPDVIVIGFHEQIPDSIKDWAHERGGEILRTDDVLHWVSIRLPDAGSAGRAMVDAAGHPEVRYAERDGYAIAQVVTDLPHWVYAAGAGGAPDDPLFSQQWGFEAIRAPEAWEVNSGSHKVRVAVVDSGLDLTHPDLAANVCGPHRSFVQDEPTLEDLRMHGTHVAGTVGAVSDNGIGVAGTSQSCLMGVKVLNRFGQGQWSDIAAGVRWAVDNGADIVSLSLGGQQTIQAMEDAVNHAYAENDVLVVAAAGNTGCSLPQDRVLYPARFPAVMAVASLAEPGNQLSSFSSCGPSVEIAAPGSHILSTLPGGVYASWSGTSMATPHVSGTAALMLAEHPFLSATAVRCVLAVTTQGMPGPLPKMDSGWGRLDAFQAVTLGSGDPFGGSTPGFSPDHLNAQSLLVNNCLGGTVFSVLGVDPAGLPLP